MGKIPLTNLLRSQNSEGILSSRPCPPLAFVYEHGGKAPTQRTARSPKQGFIYLFLWQKLQQGHSPARRCLCSSRFPRAAARPLNPRRLVRLDVSPFQKKSHAQWGIHWLFRLHFCRLAKLNCNFVFVYVFTRQTEGR